MVQPKKKKRKIIKAVLTETLEQEEEAERLAEEEEAAAASEDQDLDPDFTDPFELPGAAASSSADPSGLNEPFGPMPEREAVPPPPPVNSIGQVDSDSD